MEPYPLAVSDQLSVQSSKFKVQGSKTVGKK
jgi:hypothetical protein